jgi:hypothetical protein
LYDGRTKAGKAMKLKSQQSQEGADDSLSANFEEPITDDFLIFLPIVFP